jgi:hypothetical protein
MTAINIIRQRSSVHVFTDGASVVSCSPSLIPPPGQSLHPSCKILTLPHLNAVVAGRGSRLLPLMLADILGGLAKSYDELKSVSVAALHAYLPQLIEILRARGAADPSLDLVIAGISESAGPDSFFICNHDRHPTLPAWTLVDMPDATMAPINDQIEEEFRRTFPAPITADDLRPDVDGVRMMQIQRDIVPEAVGGFVQMASVTAGSIVTRIIHRW